MNCGQLLHLIASAARVIRENADDLKRCSTTAEGDWPDAEDRASYERDMLIADQLCEAGLDLEKGVVEIAQVQHDACVRLVKDLLDPEALSHTANPEIRDRARCALGLRPCETRTRIRN